MMNDPAPFVGDAQIARDWNPPILSEAECEHALLLGRAWRPLLFAINRLRVLLRPSAAVRHSQSVADLVVVAASVNGVCVELLLARTDIMALARHIEPDLTRLDVADDALAALLDWLSRADTQTSAGLEERQVAQFTERYADLSVSFLHSRSADVAEADVFLGMTAGPFRLQIGIRHGAAAVYSEALSRWPLERRDYRQAKFAVRFSCGHSNLTTDEIGSLRIGDVIIIDDGPDDVDSRFIIAEDTVFHWSAIHERISRVHSNHGARRMMSDDFADFDDQDDFESLEAPENALTKVAFLAGVAQVSIDDLQAADVGYIFKIGREVGSVDIVVGGKKIGVGQIVQIKEGCGIRITQLVDP